MKRSAWLACLLLGAWLVACGGGAGAPDGGEDAAVGDIVAEASADTAPLDLASAETAEALDPRASIRVMTFNVLCFIRPDLRPLAGAPGGLS